MKQTSKRIWSLLLVAALALTLLPAATVFATNAADGSGPTPGESICSHIHDESCGYAEGADCGHIHDEDCGADGADCTHTHDEDCGYIQAAPCAHVHDADCGGLADGQAADSDSPPSGPSLGTSSIVAFTPLTGEVAAQEVTTGTPLADLDLPDALAATVADGDGGQIDADIPVARWSAAPDYDPQEIGTYTFTPELAAGYTLESGAALPEITVRVVMGMAPFSFGVKIDLADLSGMQTEPTWSYNGSGALLLTQAGGQYTITGAPDNNLIIRVNNGLTVEVVLDNVGDTVKYTRFDCNGGNVTLTLVGDNVLRSTSGPALECERGATLTIQGDGSLDVSVTSPTAGIGSIPGSTCGEVDIQGGKVTAYSSGGSDIGYGGSLTVGGGAVVTLRNGGTNVDTTSFSDCTIDYAYNGTVATYGSGGDLEHVELDLRNVNAALPGFTLNSGTVSLDGSSPAYTLTTDRNNVTNRSIYVNPGVTAAVTLEDLHLAYPSMPFVVADDATVDLTLRGTNTLGNAVSGSGLIVHSGASVTVGEDGAGRLEATGRYGDHDSAGIAVAGELVINSGTVVANGGQYGAGIGGDAVSACGTVTINGGTVNATGGTNAAGIGGGLDSNGGTVNIDGGTVNANGGTGAAGIGGGYTGYIDRIAITGGQVTADGVHGIGDGADVISASLELIVKGGAALTMPGGGINLSVTDNLEIGECVINGAGTGSYAGTYSPLTVTDGAAAYTNPGYWIDGVVKDGTAVTLTADSKAGYAFTGWQTDPASFTFSGDSFAMPTHKLAVRALYNGTIHAQTPVIGAQPTGGSFTQNAPATLTVGASVSDGGTLSYQWYSNTSNSNAGGAAISGATNSSYSPSTAQTGTGYYYVVVTNTNDSVNGNKTAATTSNPVTVTVTGSSDNGNSGGNGGNGGSSSYTVSYHANGGSGRAPGQTSVTAGGSYTIASPTSLIAPAGQRFKEWNTNSTGSGTRYTPGQAITMPSRDLNLYAIWEDAAGSYTVTFHPGGGSVSPSTMQTGTNGKLAALPTPTHTGSYAFEGWYTARDGGTKITTGTVFTTDTTVYARWRYTGSGSDGNGGSDRPDQPTNALTFAGLPDVVRVGVPFTLTPSGDTRTGSDGWTWDAEYFSATFNSPATFTPLKEGATTISYTGLTGSRGEITVTILAAEDADPHNPNTGGDSTDNPQTGDFGPSPWWWLLALIPAAGAAIWFALAWRRRTQGANA